MAVLGNRAGVFTTTMGPGAVTLGSAIPAGTAPHAAAWQTFSGAGIIDGNSVRYLILDSNGAWEYGPGTVGGSGTTLTRPATSMNGSVAGQKSSTGSLLNLSGNAQVFIAALAEDIIPGGSNTQIQFNNGGTFGGSPDLIWDDTTNQLTTSGDVNARTFASDADWTNTELESGANDHFNGAAIDLNAHKTSGTTGFLTGINLRATQEVDAGATGTGVQGIHIITEITGPGTFGPGNQAVTIEAFYNVSVGGTGGYLSAGEYYANHIAPISCPYILGLASQAWVTDTSGGADLVHAFSATALIEGTCNIAYGIKMNSTVSGSANSNYIIFINEANIGGTVTNHYGLYISRQDGKASGDSKNIMSKGSTSINHFEGIFLLDQYEELSEISDPAAPAANKARLYIRDNGAGKSQLAVRFPTGAVQVIATEP